jgi:hypothetical protein
VNDRQLCSKHRQHRIAEYKAEFYACNKQLGKNNIDLMQLVDALENGVAQQANENPTATTTEGAMTINGESMITHPDDMSVKVEETDETIHNNNIRIEESFIIHDDTEHKIY